MDRLWRLADRMGPSRERYIDLLRAVAIVAVVVGHWLVSSIGYDEQGRLTGRSALPALPWAYPITWVVQVIPVFFIVGGYANAASLSTHRQRGQDAIGWLQDRSARLVRPTTALFVVLCGGAVLAQAVGGAPDLVRYALWVASIPLWFLSAYLVVVLLAPLTYRLHARFGWWVIGVLVGLVAIGDVFRWYRLDLLAAGSFVFGWLAMHQVGYFWRDGRLVMGPRLGVPLLAGGLAALVLLTVIGPYPITMIQVPGQRLQNTSPPTVALLADATAQLGLVLLLYGPAQRWLRRTRPWRAVVAINAVVLTIFLWHMTAVLVLVGVLAGAGWLHTPAAGSGAWWLWRVPWLAMLAVLLAGLVAVFGRIELRGPATPPSPLPVDGRGPPPEDVAHPHCPPAGMRERVRRRAVDLLAVRLRARAAQTIRAKAARITGAPASRALLTATGYAAVVAGLLSNNLAPRHGTYAFGMPAGGLASYLVGAGLLRALR